MRTKKDSETNILVGVILIILLALTGYFVYMTLNLQDELDTLHTTSAEEKQRLSEIIQSTKSIVSNLQSELSVAEEDYEDLKDDYRKERNKNEEFQDQIDRLLGTVNDLDKLSKIDEELLQKYSKVYFLNENYTPSSINEIPNKYVLEGREPQSFHGDALPFLEKMIKRAERSGIDLKVLSAYRSFDTQAQLKGAYTQTYGSGANTFSADQGYSEHQLGTTVDLTDPATGGPWLSFENTEAFAWLEKNAYKYGFVLSYPKDNGFYIFEPWHWRFVGEDLARELHKEDKLFYNMDQREIDTYLINIFD
jgi:LAS superfamily LD-carboxypeptidase LdcB